MGIIGKVVGGTIGFAIGGPLGAMAGAAFGHAYDNIKIEKRSFYYQRGLTFDERTQASFFVAAFSMLAKLAKADGRISEEEIDAVNKFMLYDLGLNPESRAAAVKIFREAVKSDQTFGDFAAQFYGMFRYQPQMLEVMIDILFKLASADGRIAKAEEEMILSAVKIFNISDQDYKRIRSRYVSDVDKYYALLGCSSQDSDTDIKKMYRKKVAEYHPDKIASKGLPEEFTKFAGDKFREIREAYEAIKRQRGIK